MESLRQQPDIIDVKAAVQTALDYVKNLYDGNEPIRNVGLEEVKLAEDAGVWSVTVGFSRPWSRKNIDEDPLSSVSRALDWSLPRPIPIERDYKQVEIDARSGDVRRMEIRKL